MSEMPEVQKPDTAPAPAPVDPMDFLQRFPGAPSATQIQDWKNQTCNGQVRLLMDRTGKRVFVLRGLSAREWEQAQNEMVANVTPEKLETELATVISCRACLWTNISQNNKLTPDVLRNTGAGMISAIYDIVSTLSDFMPPAMLERLSADL